MTKTILDDLYSELLFIEKKILDDHTDHSYSDITNLAWSEGNHALTNFMSHFPDLKVEAIDLFERWLVQMNIIATNKKTQARK